MDKYICHKCEHEFTWDNGNSTRGSIYECEECGKFICVSCMYENKRYSRKIKDSIDGVSGLDKIICLKCFNE